MSSSYPNVSKLHKPGLLNDIECLDQLRNISVLDVTAISNLDVKEVKYTTSGLVQRLYADLEHMTNKVVPTNSGATGSDAGTHVQKSPA